MRRRGYPDEVATGAICAGGTLGILIPPSITFILYGIATETSIGRLFLAGVLPGAMLTGLFHPPVGLNIYIVKAIAPDVPVTRVMWGTIPYVLCMMLQIGILCAFPEIATWLPDRLMGTVH